MNFEYDPAKSEANKRKHGIDFEEAKKIWDDLAYLEIPAKVVDESRFVVIGSCRGKLWAAVITYRNEHIRLISARRARKEEQVLYESL